MTTLAEWGLLDPLDGDGAALVGDDAVLAALVEVELALTKAWADTAGAPEWVGHISFDGDLDRAAIAAGNRAGGNPVIPLVPQLRAIAELGHAGAGDWVHRGATSQDILDSALMLVAARALASARLRLTAIGSTLAALADTHRETIMVGRTLTQQAAPITFGVKVASWLDGIVAALDALDVPTPVQLAGAVGTSQAFADLGGDPNALRAATALRLGLGDPQRSWQAERSPVARVASAAALTVGVLGRIATDVLVLARNEVGELSEGSGGTSSAMPQKQNPTGSVLVRSAALQVPGLLATVQASMLTEDERPAGAWHAEWLALRSLLRLAIEAAIATEQLVKGLVIDADRMRGTLDANPSAWAEHAQSVLALTLGHTDANAAVAAALADGTLLELEVDFSDASIVSAANPIVDASIRTFSDRKGRS